MGSTNIGDQKITYSFNYPGEAIEFNKINYNIMPNGIYSGGQIQKVSNTQVSVSPLVVYIKVESNETCVKVETTETAFINVNSSKTYIVASYNWNNTINDYLQIKSVAYGDIQSDYLILGNACYNGSTLSSVFDLTTRNVPYISYIKEDKKELTVESTEPFSNKVKINGGTITTVNNEITIPDTLSPSVSNTGAQGRVDIIYFDGLNILIDEGTPAINPVANNYQSKMVLATITRGPSRNYITQDDITNIQRDRFDMSEISIAGSTTGSKLIHTGYQQNLSLNTNVQDTIIDYINNIDNANIVSVTYGEEISANDPVGSDALGKYWISGESIAYNEKVNSTNYNLLGAYNRYYDMIILNNQTYLIYAWIDSASDLNLLGVYDNGSYLEWSNTLTITGTFAEVSVCPLGSEYFVIGTVEDGASYHGYVRIGFWDKDNTNNIIIEAGPEDIANTVGNEVSEVTVCESQNYPLSDTSYFFVGMLDHDFTYEVRGTAREVGYTGASARLCRFSSGSITKYDIIELRTVEWHPDVSYYPGDIEFFINRSANRSFVITTTDGDENYRYARGVGTRCGISRHNPYAGGWNWYIFTHWRYVTAKWDSSKNAETEIDTNLISITANDNRASGYPDNYSKIVYQFEESYYKGSQTNPIHIASSGYNNLVISSPSYSYELENFIEAETDIIDIAFVGNYGCAIVKNNSSYYLFFTPNKEDYDYYATWVLLENLDPSSSFVPIRLLNYQNYIVIWYKDSSDSNYLYNIFYHKIGFEGIAKEDGYKDETHPVQIKGRHQWGNNELIKYQNYYFDENTSSIVSTSGELIGFALTENDLLINY